MDVIVGSLVGAALLWLVLRGAARRARPLPPGGGSATWAAATGPPRDAHPSRDVPPAHAPPPARDAPPDRDTPQAARVEDALADGLLLGYFLARDHFRDQRDGHADELGRLHDLGDDLEPWTYDDDGVLGDLLAGGPGGHPDHPDELEELDDLDGFDTWDVGSGWDDV